MRFNKRFYWKLSLFSIIGMIAYLAYLLFEARLTDHSPPNFIPLLFFLVLACFSLLQFLRLKAKEKKMPRWTTLILVVILLLAFIVIAGIFVKLMVPFDTCDGLCVETCLSVGGRICSQPCPTDFLIEDAIDVPEGRYCCSLTYLEKC